MISTKDDLIRYKKIETNGWGLIKSLVKQKHQYVFVCALRNMEYAHAKASKGGSISIFYKISYVFWHTYYKHWQLATGLTIPKNTCEEGLTLYHIGSIVVNPACKIGRNCCIMNNVNIGANGGSDKAPIIGNNVYIGPGAVIYGDIQIADGCYIGANAVVNKSFPIPNSIIAGVPAKVIGESQETWWEKNHMDREK